MERGISPIAVLYFGVVFSLTVKNCLLFIIKGKDFTTALHYHPLGSCNFNSQVASALEVILNCYTLYKFMFYLLTY